MENFRLNNYGNAKGTGLYTKLSGRGKIQYKNKL